MNSVNPRGARIGAWLFRHRSAIPVPIAATVVLIPANSRQPPWLVTAGVVVTLAGEALRFWGVHHIGVISRTRSERLGPLVDTGPFAFVRNPLYVGNIAVWTGFALTARLPWLAPIIVLLLGAEYHAIVSWEERLLEARMGDAYRDYRARVPRWSPVFNRRARRERREKRISAVSASAAVNFTWGETLFSERGTLIAMAAGYALLWLKARF